MSTFSIITSRGTQTDITTDDRAADINVALRVAEVIHRTITLDDYQVDGVLRGTYLHNRRTERIVIIGTGLDGANAGDACRSPRKDDPTMVNLLPGPTRDAMTLAKRAVDALERIAESVPAAPPENGWLPNMNPEVGVHAQLGCELVFTSKSGYGSDTVWCNTHNTELTLILEPVVPPLDDAELAALRAKLEGK